jgi:outer membrane protein TolC
MRDLEDVLELNRAAIESARERWQEEQKLYRQGRGQLVWVIQAQDMEQNARLTYAQNAATYHQLLIDLRELTDQIVDGSASR